MPGASSVVPSSVFLKTSTLLPFISAVLLLLLMVASLVVWRMMKQQKKGEGTWLTPGWGWAGGEVCGIDGQHGHPGTISPRGYLHSLEGVPSQRPQRLEV